MKNLLYTALIALIGLTSCRSIEKMVDQGRYDDAIYLATKKLAGKKNKKTKHIEALEEAFFKVNNIEQDQIAFLKAKNDPSTWDEIHELYGKIAWRQDRISGFLPLISNDGYVAEFNFVDTRSGQENAKEHALKFHYTEASTLLQNAIASRNKQVARRAFAVFTYLDKYDRNYKNANILRKEAYDLGLNHVLLQWDESIVNLAPNVGVSSYDLPSHSDMWTIYHSDHPEGITLDAASTIYLANISITPERETVNNIVERRQIESLVDQVDRQGRVIRDTSGQVIQELQVENLEARIREIFRNKELRINGFVKTIDYATGLYIDQKPWEVNVIFNSDACTFRGDRRALGENTRKRINQYLEPFPSDYDMISESINEASQDIFTHLGQIDYNTHLHRGYAIN